MNEAQVKELLYQSLEVEIGGQQVYEAAIACAQNATSRRSGGSTSTRRARTRRSCDRHSHGSGSTLRSRRPAARSFGSRRSHSSSPWRWR